MHIFYAQEDYQKKEIREEYFSNKVNELFQETMVKIKILKFTNKRLDVNVVIHTDYTHILNTIVYNKYVQYYFSFLESTKY